MSDHPSGGASGGIPSGLSQAEIIARQQQALAAAMAAQPPPSAAAAAPPMTEVSRAPDGSTAAPSSASSSAMMAGGHGGYALAQGAPMMAMATHSQMVPQQTQPTLLMFPDQQHAAAHAQVYGGSVQALNMGGQIVFGVMGGMIQQMGPSVAVDAQHHLQQQQQQQLHQQHHHQPQQPQQLIQHSQQALPDSQSRKRVMSEMQTSDQSRPMESASGMVFQSHPPGSLDPSDGALDDGHPPVRMDDLVITSAEDGSEDPRLRAADESEGNQEGDSHQRDDIDGEEEEEVEEEVAGESPREPHLDSEEDESSEVRVKTIRRRKDQGHSSSMQEDSEDEDDFDGDGDYNQNEEDDDEHSDDDDDGDHSDNHQSTRDDRNDNRSGDDINSTDRRRNEADSSSPSGLVDSVPPTDRGNISAVARPGGGRMKLGRGSVLDCSNREKSSLLGWSENYESLHSIRFASNMGVVHRPYDEATYSSRDMRRDQSKRAKHLIRWRKRKDGSRESNARLVEWSDGSMSLVIGSEYFDISSTRDMTEYLYASKHAPPLYECHGQLDSRMSVAVVDSQKQRNSLMESMKRTIRDGKYKRKSAVQ